jgi:hypothetical protein
MRVSPLLLLCTFLALLAELTGLLCLFFNTDFSFITLLLELMAADSFCKVGVMGTEGDKDGCFEGGGGGGSSLQNVPE